MQAFITIANVLWKRYTEYVTYAVWEHENRAMVLPTILLALFSYCYFQNFTGHALNCIRMTVSLCSWSKQKQILLNKDVAEVEHNSYWAGRPSRGCFSLHAWKFMETYFQVWWVILRFLRPYSFLTCDQSVCGLHSSQAKWLIIKAGHPFLGSLAAATLLWPQGSF